MRRFASLSLVAALVASCSPPAQMQADTGVPVDGAVSDDSSASQPDSSSSQPDAETMVDAGNPLFAMRPYTVRTPSGFSMMGALPLVVLLHGYGANGTGQEAYFSLREQVAMKRFFLALPNGTTDPAAKNFWNASGACCNFYRSPVDDVAYLRALIADMKSRYNIDSSRVYVIGHSNGGFMTHRLACEMSDQIAAVMSLAGAGPITASQCAPAQPVHVLQVHGDRDATILYPGGTALSPGAEGYPGAEQTVADWALRNGCAMARSSAGADLDLDSVVAGAETTREAHTGCRAGGSAELWRIRGGGHIPAFTTAWAPAVIDWLYAHSRAM